MFAGQVVRRWWRPTCHVSRLVTSLGESYQGSPWTMSPAQAWAGSCAKAFKGECSSVSMTTRDHASYILWGKGDDILRCFQLCIMRLSRTEHLDAKRSFNIFSQDRECGMRLTPEAVSVGELLVRSTGCVIPEAPSACWRPNFPGRRFC
jgi:hypothetical protein